MDYTIYLLTTHDNPFDPYNNFDSWFMFDLDHNHNCCTLLARFGNFSDQLTTKENFEEQKRAIDQIISFDPLNIYKRFEVLVKIDEKTGEIIE